MMTCASSANARRFAFSVLLLTFVVACATPPTRQPDVVVRAGDALGGSLEPMIPPRHSLAAHRSVAGHIKKYAEMYDLDWLLMASLAYEESRLDPRARGRGTIGVMQIKPGTARSPAVGIADIWDPEMNVHAGVKYVRAIIKEYVPEPAVSPLDKQLIAMAGYKAGPLSLPPLRARAAARGLDPDRWFGHLERVASASTAAYIDRIHERYQRYRREADIMVSAYPKTGRPR